MLEMKLDVHTGFVEINNYPIELKDVDTFKNSAFYKFFSPLTTVGPFYFAIDNVQWRHEWGNIVVQSNEKSFDCGVYIEWNV